MTELKNIISKKGRLDLGPRQRGPHWAPQLLRPALNLVIDHNCPGVYATGV